jgi:hypothetical protein
MNLSLYALRSHLKGLEDLAWVSPWEKEYPDETLVVHKGKELEREVFASRASVGMKWMDLDLHGLHWIMLEKKSALVVQKEDDSDW